MGASENVDMAAEIIRIETAAPERAFARAREVVRAGGVIVYPTDTFYGLGVDPRNPVAVRRLFAIKSRPADRPVLVLIPDAAAAADWAVDLPPVAERLRDRFWPGPLTLVVRARGDVDPALTAGTGTIGLRVPGSDLTRRLLAAIGTALTGTSANRTGGRDARTAQEAAQDLGGDVDLILDGGPAPGRLPSTVVDAFAVRPVVLREGAVGLAELREIAPELERSRVK